MTRPKFENLKVDEPVAHCSQFNNTYIIPVMTRTLYLYTEWESTKEGV